MTPLGEAVFGAPERAATETSFDEKFLTIQPNHEIIAYLDVADPRLIFPLAQMAHGVSASAERVQTFALSRESVYQALETGSTPEAMKAFLTRHSRTGLPDLVARSLTEWGRKREALVFRTDVALAASPVDGVNPFQDSAEARPVAGSVVLLPPAAARGRKGWLVRDHQAFARPVWEVDEEGRVRITDQADSVCLARLSQFADPAGEDWLLTAASVARAHERGIAAEQILDWLRDHLSAGLPAIIETAIRNWSHPAAVFLGELVMLQINQAQAYDTIRNSPRFQPLLLGAVPPHWFIVRKDKQEDLQRLLTELGFAVGAAWKQAAAGGRGDDGSPSRKPGRKPRKR